MKKLFRRLGLALVLSLATIILSGLTSHVQAATGPNLIANPSMEQPSTNKPGHLPQGWTHSNWGTNTVGYSYLKTGQEGGRSVKVNIASYTDGDAKWFAGDVDVKAASQYVYSDYYRANISSEVVVRVTDEDGNVSYQWLGTAAKTNTWKKVSYVFNTPAKAKSVTVLHLITGRGWLILDNTSLAQYTPDVPVVTSGVPNNSLEQVNDLTSSPLAWQNSKWGTNTATFSFSSTGNSGDHSARVDMTKYTDGDAKWYFDAQPAQGGQTYSFSDYYKSSIDTRVVVAANKSDGTTVYLNLKNAPASPSGWTQYSDAVELPTDTLSVTVFHLIAGVGYLSVDDYSFVPTTVHGFNSGLVSLTFDDGWKSIYTNGLPILSAHHVLSTQYILTGNIDNDPLYMTSSDVQALKDAGHQIASHTVTHPDLTTLAFNDMMAELTNSKNFLENNFGSPVQDFASPYGAYNSSSITAIKTLYRSHRSVDEGYNSKDNFDLYNIRVQNILTTTTPEQVASWVTKAKTDKTWLVLVYHQVDGSGDSYAVTPAGLEAHISAIEQSGLPVKTVDQAIAELAPQI